MRNFKDLIEARGDTAVFTLGRFNPPTTGHEKLIKKMDAVAKKNSAPMYVFPTHSTDPAKNPLPHGLKVAYMKKMYRKYAKNIQISKARNVFEVAKVLHDKGHKAIIMVVGSDRVSEFSALLDKYNGVESTHGYYGFDNIEVISAGERDPDAEGVSGMSASKMRAAAADGDKDSFLKGIPSGFKDGDKLYSDVRKNMGIREDRDMGDMSDFEQVRDAYLTGKIWNVGDSVIVEGVEGEVVRKGTNYLSYVTEDGKVHKAWLHNIQVDESRMSALDKLRKFDKSRTGKSPIFTDKKGQEFVRMKKKGMMTIMNVPSDEVDKYIKKGYDIIESAELDERNYAKEYANYHSRPEQIANRSSRNKARRVMGDKTKIGMDVGHVDNNPMNNSPDNLRNEDPSVNRREPRLRDEAISDILPWLKKLTTVSHPRGMEKLAKEYTKRAMEPKYKGKPNLAAFDVARETDDVSPREFVRYINKLVDKGVLPKELKAEYEVKEVFSFKEFTQAIQEVKQDKDIKDKEGTQPAKYYAGDMAKSTKDKRAAHFKKNKSGPAPGDSSAKTKPSVHTKKFKQMFGEVLPDSATQKDYIDDFEKSDAPQFQGKSKEKRREMAIAAYLSKNENFQLDEKIAGLVKKADKSGMPYGILKKVYDRGMAAWKTGHRPGTTPQQWAFARVNSFTTKSSGTWGKADKDLAKQVRGEELEEDPCWDTHKQVGMKKKGGKMVPNCVPKNEEPRIPRKKGQPAGSDKHSDLYTDENPVGTIQGLGFKDVETAKASVKKIIGSGKSHAHKIQAAIAMEQRAKEMGKSAEAAVYRKYIDKMKQKTKEMQEDAEDDKLQKTIKVANAKMNLAKKIKQMKTQQKASIKNIKDKDQKKNRQNANKQQVKTVKDAGKNTIKQIQKQEFELNSWGEITEKDDKSGKELNNPTRGDVKKYKVYVKNDKGNVVKVEFGDPNMSIKRDDPEARKAFRARHNCDQKKDKTTAGYWSCKFWSTKSVTDLMKG